MIAHDVAKGLYVAFRLYNEDTYEVATAAANALNSGEPVDGWMLSPVVAKASKVVGLMTVLQALCNEAVPLEARAARLTRVVAAVNLRGRGLIAPHSCVTSAANALIARVSKTGFVPDVPATPKAPTALPALVWAPAAPANVETIAAATKALPAQAAAPAAEADDDYVYEY